jgi:ribosomal protein S18 acetylase RimI-like enzyme
MYTIRNCVLTDYRKVLYFLRELWPDKKLITNELKTVYENGINNENQIYICAETEDRMVGFCSLTIVNSFLASGKLAYIDELIVDRNFRRKGIGLLLLSEIERIAKEKYCNQIELVSAFHRENAHLFYERYGFNKEAFLFTKKLQNGSTN